MRKLLFILFMFVAFIINANEFHYYFSMNQDGKIVKYEVSEHAYTVTINSLVISADHHVSCDMTIRCPHPAEAITILRRHPDGNPGDENDPNWNMQTQPTVNPEWCSYEVLSNGTRGCVIRFVDTFPMSWYLDELSTANALKYYVRDSVNGHTLNIQINNVFYYSIITGLNDVYDNTVIYYDINGNSSNQPFKGINIVKGKYSVYKLIN